MSGLSPELSLKYNAYQNAYDHQDWWIGEARSNFDPKFTPELLDAFFTGCTLPCQSHTHTTYTQEIEDDIKEIIIQSPQTIHCNMGHLRCRDKMTPLAAACSNKNIPIHMIEFLLENGADHNLPILVSNQERLILDDLESNRDKENFTIERYQDIEELFSLFDGINIKG